MLLQWPHHGAKNFTKTVLPAVFSSQVSFVSSMAATAANMDSNGRLRMASMAMAEVGLERGSDTTHKKKSHKRFRCHNIHD